MTGTIVNAGAILAGGLIGLAAGRRIPERVKTILMQALGLSTLIIGLQMALSARELIPIVGSLLLGALTGELLRIEDGLEQIGHWLKKRARSDSSTFVAGFVTASLLYCTGAMVVVGAIQDGTTGNATTLYIKAMLDGVASIAFASTLGIGVLFSAASVFLVQGSITLLSSNLVFLQQPAVLGPVTSTGGLLIVAIAINLLNVAKIRIGNLLPALVYAVLIAMV
ncbi:MAG: putative membrane protein YdfK [Syntrophorhabdus sp. PtaU1.Bin002]|nr:MAG: putative membrane protein YdfK [Syntrophorhabdus sp. PtaB.Bin006]OPY73736.1 MAG: putative membrane protein YdfK [Syntrophorhabdus sp. PtaU1.Bin002]